ncbi:UDP-N-acetylmuramate dehydrogenase [Paenibacillus sp. GCM10012307]|uniref:UDP-N-acetylenolpyruvoylglucosamine reductase n=1 Tax=Paenibacillus roseus TaxID=2798579 RepID=A0A934IUX4_9BACL|nr:UDP-N-acetylmuramate dehydrogenase [Paenibacillus roseus]MBJ6359792.1 UDP-N-acetylmuramate dehydrogenase [Paenibacillus roseus]
MFNDLSCIVEERFPLKQITTMGVGGPCRYYIAPDRVEQLEQIYSRCRHEGLPVLVIGNGSNVLVDDAGFDGVVIHVGKKMKNFTVSDGVVQADSGVLLPKLALTMAKEGGSGFEFMAGIPGTVGGAVIMNAGCIGKETSSVLKSVTYLDEEGRLQYQEAKDLGLAFRSSSLLGRSVVILRAEFHVVYNDDQPQVMERTKQAAAIRKGKFPLNVATVGSTFKSPPQGPHPGRLIEEVGLKGHRIGGAEISTVHANWIINLGTATARDVKELMTLMQEKVLKSLGIEMEPEVLMV